MKIDDIEGTRAKPSIFSRTSNYDSFNYQDVYAKKQWTNRLVNPLDPVYKLKDSATGDFTKTSDWGATNEKYGEIPGSKPAALPKPVSGVRNLKTQDI